jgi:hypothetical protein
LWLAGNKSGEMTPTMYLLSDLNALGAWYEADDLPEIRGAVRIWSDELTDASQSVLDETLGEIADLELVNDWQSVVDEDAFGELGCHPWVGGRAMLRFQRPLARGDQYFVEANIDQGCQCVVSLLRIESTGSEFEVTDVIRDGDWIV